MAKMAKYKNLAISLFFGHLSWPSSANFLSPSGFRRHYHNDWTFGVKDVE